MKTIFTYFFIVAVIFGVTACGGADSTEVTETTKKTVTQAQEGGDLQDTTNDAETKAPVAVPEPIQAIPSDIKVDVTKVTLGEMLYNDKRLSKNNVMSCATCHDLAKGGVDHQPRSKGVMGKLGGVNSPTVYNSGLNFAQFWDGRAKDLVEQASGPVHNPIEMASSWKEAIGKLKRDRRFRKMYQDAYGKGEIEGDNLAEAIAEFEKTLLTPNSPFDKWLGGDKAALSAEALAGYELFKGYGCDSCHNGPNVGGNSFQRFGLVKDYLVDVRGNVTADDFGRFNVTKDEADKFKFKVPSLRTAVLTPPYFHDASAKTIEDAIQIMGRHQIGVELEPLEVKQIKAFLISLVGEYKGESLIGQMPK